MKTTRNSPRARKERAVAKRFCACTDSRNAN